VTPAPRVTATTDHRHAPPVLAPCRGGRGGGAFSCRCCQEWAGQQRRWERATGVAIREGQERGEIRGNGGDARSDSSSRNLIPGPQDFASKSDIYGASAGRPGIYALADGATDEQFDTALTEARDEGNLKKTRPLVLANGTLADLVPLP